MEITDCKHEVKTEGMVLVGNSVKAHCRKCDAITIVELPEEWKLMSRELVAGALEFCKNLSPINHGDSRRFAANGND